MTRDIALRLEDIADASLREDGTDIPLGEQLREAAREILRLRSRVEELENLVQANVQGSGAVNDPVCQWQDISTAPTDGTWFLICRDDEGPESFEVGCFDPQVWSSYEPAENGLYRKVEKVINEWRGFNNFHRATHWMPPPRAPGDRTDSSTAAHVSLNQPKALSPSTVSEE